jgi:preprotein translocase subunit SecB
MAHSNLNENVMKIKIKFCEIFQNDVSLEEEPFPETSQGNESLQLQLNIIPKSDQENVN